MIFPEKMVRLTVVGPKSVLEKTIKELYSLKMMHIIDHTKGDIDIGLPLDKADDLSGFLVTVRALKGKLKLEGKANLSNGFKAIAVKSFNELGKTITDVNEDIRARETAISEVGEELKGIEFKAALLEQLGPIQLPLETYNPYRSLACFIGTVSDTKNLGKEISSITEKSKLYISDVPSKKSIIALFIYKEYSQQAEILLGSHGFVELDLSPLAGMKGLPSILLQSLQEKELASKKKLSAAKLALEKSIAKWEDFLLLSEKFLIMELEKAQAPLKFAATKNIFVISGWIPEKKLDFAKQELGIIGSDKISIEVHYPEEQDSVPALLNNPKHTKPFEFFLRLYDMPRHTEIDPTSIMAITFPILFGFIIGDIGYGIVLLSLFILMKKKLSGLGDLVHIFTLAAIGSIFFGFVYGEFFGAEELFGYELPRLLNRVHHMMDVMYVGMGIGLLQLNFGFILGFINVYRNHGIVKAILEKLSWMLLQVGIALYALPKLGINVGPAFISYIIIFLAVILVAAGESIKGIMEIPGFFGNVLSYARLMAVGVASVQLALVINDLAGGLFSQGGFFIVAAVLILITGHTINIALGLIGGFMHPTRLHYVEFFGKFFKGGGLSYRPFGEK